MNNKFISLIVFSFCFGVVHNYQINFMGINVAKVSMAHKDTSYANQLCTIVRFNANTKAISNFFYPINNYYEIIHSQKTNQILRFRKKTSQPDLENELITELIENKAFYKNTNIYIPDNALTIFTFFYLLSNDLLKSNVYNIEREGIIYFAQIENLKNEKNNISKYKLILEKQNSLNNISILKKTDIFTWAIFKKNAKRTIWVNNSKKRIEKCYFNVGLLTLEAEYLSSYE